jgi:hypothetical protein
LKVPRSFTAVPDSLTANKRRNVGLFQIIFIIFFQHKPSTTSPPARSYRPRRDDAWVGDVAATPLLGPELIQINAAALGAH